MKSNKEILKASLPGVATTFVILFVILLFNPSFPLMLILITAFLLSKAIYKRRKLSDATGEIIGVLVVLSIIKILYTYFGSAGVWSLLLVVIFLAGVILWRARKQYLAVLRDIEKQYFGMTAEERKELRKK